MLPPLQYLKSRLLRELRPLLRYRISINVREQNNDHSNNDQRITDQINTDQRSTNTDNTDSDDTVHENSADSEDELLKLLKRTTHTEDKYLSLIQSREQLITLQKQNPCLKRIFLILSHTITSKMTCLCIMIFTARRYKKQIQS